MDVRARRLQQVIQAIFVATLTGCIVPATPLALPTSTETQAPKSSATPTPNPISSFEECVTLGNPVENIYPRQCNDDRGEVFEEALETGMLFSKTFGGKGDETADFIISTKDGGHLITGSANDNQCLVLKLDASREKEWESVFGEELREELQFSNAWFRCWSARQATEGGYVVMGTGRNELEEKPFLIKLDRDGRRVSAEIIPARKEKFAYLGRDGEIIWLNSFGISSKVIETAEGGYALIGMFPKGVPDPYIRIIKTDEKGVYLWEKNLCLDKKLQRDWQKSMVCSNTYFWEAIQSQDGGYVLTGGAGNRIGLVKTDAKANIEWMQSYSGSDSDAIIQAPDGGFLIAGERRGNGILIKTDEAGELQWSRSLGGDQHDTFTALEKSSNGEIIVLGGSKSFGAGQEDIWLVGIDITILK